MQRSLPLLRIAAATATLLVIPVAASAQAAPLVLELRGGWATPVSDFAEGMGAGEGVTRDYTASLRFALSGSSRRTIVLGFSQHRFGCAPAGCAEEGEYVATGFNGGLRFNLATLGGVIPWIGAEALTTRVEVGAHPDYADGVSDLAFGGEVGAGLYIGAFSSLALNPAVRVVAANTTLPDGQTLRMRFWVADVGLAVAF